MKIIQRIFDGDVLDLFLVDITSDNHYKQATSFKRYILREEFPYCIKCYENVFANNYIIVDICIFIICIYIVYYMQKVRPPWGVPLLHQVLRECLCQQLWRMWQDHWHWLKGEHEQYVSWKKWLNITIQFWEVQFNSIRDRSLTLTQCWEMRRLKKIDLRLQFNSESRIPLPALHWFDCRFSSKAWMKSKHLKKLLKNNILKFVICLQGLLCWFSKMLNKPELTQVSRRLDLARRGGGALG